jgi:hypothetical protein
MSRRYIYFGSFASSAWFSDLFGMPTIGLSLRKLTPNATNCIRVRRSSDNTELDIGFVANTPNSPIDTTALLSFVGAGNGFITTWYDQSTNNNNAIQTTAANQPRIVNSGVVDVLNSNTSMVMNGTSQHFILTTTITPSSSIFSSFGVAKRNSSGQSFTLYGSNLSPTPLTHLLTTGNLWFFQRQAGFLQSNSTDTSNAQMIATGISGAAFQQFKNGSIIASTNTNFAINNSINLIGVYRAAGANLHHNGPYQEIVIFSSDKATDRTSIETNINTYYNVF